MNFNNCQPKVDYDIISSVVVDLWPKSQPYQGPLRYQYLINYSDGAKILHAFLQMFDKDLLQVLSYSETVYLERFVELTRTDPFDL